ncbi:DUF6374 family protein [Nocardia sp. NPDC005745]|uniref:DUF6374 family protein n=1 Tax=Nocardia sp. NPDC005745 TaxID=3157061 RepID=UPI0033F04F51
MAVAGCGAFGKQLSPEQLERAAGRIGEALRAYAGMDSSRDALPSGRERLARSG